MITVRFLEQWKDYKEGDEVPLIDEIALNLVQSGLAENISRAVATPSTDQSLTKVSLGYLQARRKGLMRTIEGIDAQIAELQRRLGLQPAVQTMDAPPADKMVRRGAVTTKGV